MVERTDNLSDEWVPLNVAAREIGLSRVTLRQRITSGDLRTWDNPLDRRQRLLRRRDVERFMKPRQHEEGAPIAAA